MAGKNLQMRLNVQDPNRKIKNLKKKNLKKMENIEKYPKKKENFQIKENLVILSGDFDPDKAAQFFAYFFFKIPVEQPIRK